MKPKLAFIDHSFHQKTKASAFLLELLKKEYEVEIFRDEAWHKGPRVDLKRISEEGYNPVVFFQVFRCPEEDIKYLRNKRVILFPMFDACPVSADFFWKNYRHIPDVRFVNFSKTLHLRITKFGFTSKYFRYFPPVEKTPQEKIDSGKLKGFFWQRTNRITWNHIRALIKKANFEKFNIHSAIDPPGFKFIQPGEEEIKQYNINITKWFTGREDYLRVVREANVFFAPRVKEGIGMAFLEAMAMGKCVVAADNPTMNEYITHGKTGLLYNPRRPEPLDFSNIEEICAGTRNFAHEGHKKWRQSQEELLAFIKEPLPKGNTEGVGKLKRSTALYFLYRQFLHNQKVFIKKFFPRAAKLLLQIKRKI
jgi:glycosyltransferase involved in cell wall biosynthesis